jgi:demethylmenaquinone methyltransferase/2-methoxy-6-polyprenyl-1,4-benzoquinol methylase
MFDTIAPRYDLVNRVMTFGLDRRWRRTAVRALGLPSGSLVVDVACGTGDLCRDLARVLRLGGRVALLDVATPGNLLLRTGHAAYFGHVVPRIGAALSDGDAYRYLPKSVAYLPAPPELLRMLAAAGFAAVERRLLSGGVTQLITATRRAM